MLPTNLQDIREQHIQRLLTDGIAESRHIEYKGPSYNSTSVAESVASFANDGPGDLVLGVEEDHGVPVSVVGKNVDPDAEKLSLDQAIRDLLDPHYRQHRIESVRLNNGNFVFVIRVPLSFGRPHRAGAKGAIMGRSAAGKYPMKMAQVRDMILQADALAERAREFRVGRLQILNDGHGPVPLRKGPTFVAHVVPAQAFGSPATGSGPEYQDGVTNFRPLRGSGISWLPNLEGKVFHDPSGRAYTHVYRSGIIEVVEVFDYRPPSTPGAAPEPFEFSLVPIANDLMTFAPRWLSGLGQMDVAPPHYLFLSMCRVSRTVCLGPGVLRSTLERDVILLPEIELPLPTPADLSPALRPVLDILWQAFGFEACELYDAQGVWIG